MVWRWLNRPVRLSRDGQVLHPLEQPAVLHDDVGLVRPAGQEGAARPRRAAPRARPPSASRPARRSVGLDREGGEPARARSPRRRWLPPARGEQPHLHAAEGGRVGARATVRSTRGLQPPRAPPGPRAAARMSTMSSSSPSMKAIAAEREVHHLGHERHHRGEGLVEAAPGCAPPGRSRRGRGLVELAVEQVVDPGQDVELVGASPRAAAAARGLAGQDVLAPAPGCAAGPRPW